jgi:SAM-dependent methyltransferase
MNFDAETGRDRYFELRDSELAQLVDPDTGLIEARFARRIPCPLCGSEHDERVFTKQGFTFVRCLDCSLVFVNPQLRETLVTDTYRTAETLDVWLDVLTSPRQEAFDREKFARVLDDLEPFRGDRRILDVGSSTGLFLALARDRGWDGLGLELSPRAAAFARAEYGLDVREHVLAEAGLAAETFDAVTLLSVLEHTNEPHALLRDCAQALRPGGALYVIVPNVESLACRVLGARARTFDGRNHLVYFAPRTLTDALERTGFKLRFVATTVSSLEPVLEHLAGHEPYSGADVAGDALGRWVTANRAAVERMIEELRLGYKLHCLATKCG